MSSLREGQDIPSLHPDTSIGLVTLTISDMNRSVAFYQQVLGFQVLKRTEHMTILGSPENKPLLVLVEQAGAQPKPYSTTGLYHFAILVPSREDLARSLLNFAETRYPLSGASDHTVSEALYLSDPDGNGIEIYRDRPRSEWSWRNRQVQMATDPLDLEGLLAEAERDGRPFEGLEPQTRIGHVHLQVADVRQAAEFYHGILGFDVMQQFPGALFVSAGGYHHHIGLNTWNSRGAARPPANAAGLRYFTITLPDESELARVVLRLEAAGVPFEPRAGNIALNDPWGNGILLTVGPLQNLGEVTA